MIGMPRGVVFRSETETLTMTAIVSERPPSLKLEIDGSVDLPYTVPNLFGIIGLCCGRDATDSVVPEDYQAPFAFNGEITSVTLDVTGELIVDHESELKRIIAQQ
jgi:hypothetical protein